MRWWEPDVTREDIMAGLLGVGVPAVLLLSHVVLELGAAHGIALGLGVAGIAFVNGAAWGARRFRARVQTIDEQVNAFMSDGMTHVLNAMLREGIIKPGPNFPREGETREGVATPETWH
jgi:Zn-dependent alcohol dehydrogenase